MRKKNKPKETELLIKEYINKSISDLRFIISNNQSHTKEEVIAAEQVVEIKLNDWRYKNLITTQEIDGRIRKQTWFDFHVLKFDGNNLLIAGGIDLTYCHSLEIIFEGVFFVAGFFNGWASNTNSTVIEIPENEWELNTRYEIEQDYQVFVFKTENYDNDVIIAANCISFNTDTVYYYDRPNLKKMKD